MPVLVTSFSRVVSPRDKKGFILSRFDTYKTISELIEEWNDALEKYGDIKVVIDYDNQYCWSPSPQYFKLMKNKWNRYIKQGELILEADNG
jgi:hypothetical protein